ncbi:esterase, partial [Rhodococcus jostii]
MEWLHCWSLITGPLPGVVTVFGVAGGLWLVLTPTTGTRVYRRRLAPIAILVAATSTTGLRW